VSSGYVLQATKQALKFCRARDFAISYALDDLVVADIGKKQQPRARFLSDREIHDLLAFIEGKKGKLTIETS